MRIKIYNFLVNRHPGIKSRYHHVHENSSGVKRAFSWIYLFWLNFAYYVLFCRFLGKKEEMQIYESKKLMTNTPESKESPDIDKYIATLAEYDCISFDIFDTLIFRPFSEPTDVFYFLGLELDYMDFKRVRMEAEYETRMKKYKKSGTYEVTIKDIWNHLEEKTGIPAEKGMQREQELERKFCYANPFMQKVYNQLVEMGKRIIIVSDMYLSREFLQKLLQENGYVGFEKLYVSCEYDKNKGTGELFAYVKEDLKLDGKRVIHVGDNENSDVKKPKSYGFESCYYPNVNKKSQFYRPYDMSPVIGGAYRGIVNNHLYCGDNKHTMEYEYGYIYGGLFVVGYCEFIHDYCQKNQVDKILFLSRDGDILSQVYSKMYPMDSIQYVYWSRKAATKLMASSDKYDFIRRFVHHKVNKKITIEQVFSSMEAEILLPKLPSEINREDELTSSNVKRVEMFLQENWTKLLACYTKEHEAAKCYYAKVLKDCKKVVAVDIGWAGSGAIALNHLVNKVWNLNCDIVGIIAGSNTVHNAEPEANVAFLQSGRLVSYMYSFAHNRDLMKKHDLNKDYNIFWELLLSSPQPQFAGFTWGKDGEEELRFGKYDANQEGIRQVQEGILQFADEYLAHFGNLSCMLCISGRDAYAPMLVATGCNERYLKEMKDRFDLIVGVE